jgi:hypothetical protein
LVWLARIVASLQKIKKNIGIALLSVYLLRSRIKNRISLDWLPRHPEADFFTKTPDIMDPHLHSVSRRSLAGRAYTHTHTHNVLA